MATYYFKIFFLVFILHGTAEIRRITHYVDFIFGCMRAYCVPVEATGVAADYVAGWFQGESFGEDKEFFLKLDVHLMFGEPHGERCGLGSILVEFNAIELSECDVREWQQYHAGNLTHRFPDADFKLAQSLIGDDKEVAATAGRIKEFDV